jgi:hypothetical protein
MTWPASDVVRTNADATTDSPSSFRVDVLDLIDKFNQLRNHVSAFIQALLDDANAPAARATLGAAASGANADITGLSALASLPAALTPLGVGQAWYNNATLGRSLDTYYNNGTGRPIMVAVATFSASGTHATVTAEVGGVNILGSAVLTPSGGGSNVRPFSFVVPAGANYRVFTIFGSPSLSTWSELR